MHHGRGEPTAWEGAGATIESCGDVSSARVFGVLTHVQLDLPASAV